ncbi:MAG: hypothetical protein BWY82_02667 [Verrucomicrobia bacterium ADurb.Bin474]|nr:MAG: hypothetical protein BWY82_02667 [Verrucomicrobia bacterium ADurb.Bin474]
MPVITTPSALFPIVKWRIPIPSSKAARVAPALICLVPDVGFTIRVSWEVSCFRATAMTVRTRLRECASESGFSMDRYGCVSDHGTKVSNPSRIRSAVVVDVSLVLGMSQNFRGCVISMVLRSPAARLDSFPAVPVPTVRMRKQGGWVVMRDYCRGVVRGLSRFRSRCRSPRGRSI